MVQREDLEWANGERVNNQAFVLYRMIWWNLYCFLHFSSFSKPVPTHIQCEKLAKTNYYT